jgi:hypothetical protein
MGRKRVMRDAITGTWLVLTCLVPGSAFAQVAVQRIAGGSTCSGCLIETQRLASVSDAALPGSILDFAWAGTLRDGRFYVVTGWSGQELYIANPAGAITQRIGRAGQGPGEYRAPHYVLDVDSFLVVIDVRNRRATYLTRDRLQFVRTTPLSGAPLSRPVALSGNRFLINAIVSGDAGHPLHVIDSDGRVLRSFGQDSRSAGAVLTSHTATRVTAAASDGSVWVAHPNEYRIEKWDSTGRLTAVYERTLTWFPRRTADATGAGLPRITALHEAEPGKLWVEIRTTRPAPAARENRTFPADHSNSETYVEILDMQARSVLTARQFKGWFPYSTGAGLTGSIYDDKTLEPRVHVWTYRLRR